MSQSKKKLDRMQRVRALEENQLNVLIGDLARIDAELASHRTHLADLEAMKEKGLATTHRCSVELLTQNRVWIDSVNRSIRLAREIIDKAEEERQEAQTRVLDQRTRVRGLELLIDQIGLEIDADLETQQMLMADENALKNFARN